MKKLVVQYANNKFINNIHLSDTNYCEKWVLNTKNNLYKLYYSLKFNYLILVSSSLETEESQFINEFCNDIKIYIYNDNNDDSLLQKYPNIEGILQHHKPNIKESKIITIPILVNDKIFYNKKIEKNNNIVCFLENISEIPKELMEYLYPNSHLPIKLFNNKKVHHPQNLGLLTEQDKADLLQQSLYYLAIDNEYIPEAWACNCRVLEIKELKTLEPKQYKYSKTFQSYVNFLKGIVRD
jgi:hypothetical protein